MEMWNKSLRRFAGWLNPLQGKGVTVNDVEYVEKLRQYLSEIKGRPPKEGITHMMELLLLMRFGVGGLAEFSGTQYGHESLSCRAAFADGKTYRIEITEVSGSSAGLKKEDEKTDKNT